MIGRSAIGCSRRGVVMAAAAWASAIAVPSAKAASEEPPADAIRFVQRLVGRTPTLSSRLRLFMPRTFPNGYTVPLAFDVDTPMTQEDFAKSVRIFAPKNPLVDVATFHFSQGRTQARVATRIRLSQPQTVIALADMNDGSLLMATAWVAVASDGCK